MSPFERIGGCYAFYNLIVPIGDYIVTGNSNDPHSRDHALLKLQSVAKGKIAMDFEKLKAALPDFEFLIALIPIPGPGNYVVLYDAPSDVKVACVTPKYQVIWNMSATTVAPIAKH